jgi:hypothetical protein
VYFFKYKEKKEDNAWKIGSAGLYPKDSTLLRFEAKSAAAWPEVDEDDFTELSSTKLTAEKPVAEQLEQQRKMLLYSRRKSAQKFYENEVVTAMPTICRCNSEVDLLYHKQCVFIPPALALP